MTGQKEPVDVVHLNFSQAFDSANDCLLINKVAVMGIHVKINRCVQKVRNRTFGVKLGGRLSSEGTVKSGVPQVSVLGPLLFLIFSITWQMN